MGAFQLVLDFKLGVFLILARQSAGLDHGLAACIQHSHNLAELIFKICHEEDCNTTGRVAMLLWMIWNNRNDIVWNQKKEPGRSLGVKAMHFWQDWYVLQQHNSTTVQQLQLVTWEKPPMGMGWLKCNIDAGFHHDINKTSAGWCLRNHLGKFIKAGTTWKEAKYFVIEGETLALLEAMMVLDDEGATQVIFETNSKCVVDAIYKSYSGTSEFSAIICNIKSMLLSNSNFVVKFINRQANMVAHTLARAAIS